MAAALTTAPAGTDAQGGLRHPSQQGDASEDVCQVGSFLGLSRVARVLEANARRWFSRCLQPRGRGPTLLLGRPDAVSARRQAEHAPFALLRLCFRKWRQPNQATPIANNGPRVIPAACTQAARRMFLWIRLVCSALFFQ